MSWYSPLWQYRTPIAIDNSAGGATTIDGAVTLPVQWSRFWDTIESDGHSVRFTQSDGMSLCAYNRATWTYADKAAVFNIDAITAIANQTTQIFMYWGYASVGDGSTSPTISSAKTGEVEVGCPSVPIITARLDPFGATTAGQRFQKTVNEVLDVWVDCRQMLEPRCAASSGSLRYEEIHSVDMNVTTGGSSQGSMFDETFTRFIDPGWVRVRVKAGSTQTAYTIIPKITTSLGRVLEARAVMKVENTDET